MRKVLTLCVIQKGECVLLGMKKTGFGEGKWNGFGGHVEEGETIEEGMAREVQEEAGLKLRSFEKRGILEFTFDTGDIHEVHVFSSNSFEGDPTESDEMRPEWFFLDEIPYEEMWEDDRHWLPLLLKGKSFQGSFSFTGDSMGNFDLRERPLS